MPAATLRSVLKRDRLLVLASLFGLALLAWLYLIRLAGQMTTMDGEMGDLMDMPGIEVAASAGPWSDPILDFAILAAMWIVMMVGMMLPAAAPTILLFSALEHKRAGDSGGRTALFVGGYFLAWAAFSVMAAAAQVALSQAGLVSAMEMASTSAVFGGAIFLLAGVYEFSPLKGRCLTHCRSPVEWIARHHRPGAAGALQMGMEHGAYCVGCCFVLMLLLFAGGVMNLLWVAALAAIVLAQKVLPGGVFLARGVGVALVAVGLAMMAWPLVNA
jgi:predicted metal-binding membrane protein